MNITYYNRLQKLIFILDLAFLNIALLIGHYIVFRDEHPNFSSEAFVILVNICWGLISLLNKNYQAMKSISINDVIDKFLVTLICQVSSVLGAIYFLRILNLSRGFVIITFSVFFLAIIIQRIGLFYFLKNARINRFLKTKVIVLGNQAIADSLISQYSKQPEFRHCTYEYLEEGQSTDISENAYLEELLARRPDEIFVCYKEMSIGLLDKLILFGEHNSIKIKVVYDVILDHKKKNFNYDKLPILHLNSRSEVSARIRFLKRSFDIVFASVIMTSGLPVFILLYLATKTTSKGKAFYKQERVGKNEKPFYIYKFRSMHTDAEKSGPQLSKTNDPRITKWGMVMRKTRLDELPQFWNVLKGEMSIVGYRPERKHFIAEITKKTPEYKRLLDHKPGLTSLGQVHYGYAENVDQMCERLGFDLLYFRNLNLYSDVNIILKTVKVMVQAKGK